MLEHIRQQIGLLLERDRATIIQAHKDALEKDERGRDWRVLTDAEKEAERLFLFVTRQWPGAERGDGAMVAAAKRLGIIHEAAKAYRRALVAVFHNACSPLCQYDDDGNLRSKAEARRVRRAMSA